MNIKIDIMKSRKTNEEMAMFLSFPYNPTVVDIVRGLSNRWWHADKKQWEVPLSSFEKLISKLQDFEIEINAPELIEFEDKEATAEIPNGFEFKTKPFKHQTEGFEFGLKYDKWLLADEQGLGKTKQVIDIAVAKKLQKGYKHCLIICGVNGLKWNWRQEVSIHSNETAHILGQKTKNKKVTIGSNTDKLKDLQNIDKLNSYFLITNVETLRNEDIAKKIQELCDSNVINMIALDEAHKCFEYNTLITTDKGLLKIGDIVNNKLDVKVLSKNLSTNKLEWKEIKNWFANEVNQSLIELTLDTKNGIKTIKCTANHRIYTNNRGWVCAKDLTENDDIAEC